MRCARCGNISFTSGVEYRSHLFLCHSEKVVIKANNFTGRSRLAIVEETEPMIRNNAWDQHKLNPLIGRSIDTIEPEWNLEMELI